ncbi:hypothetical protein ABZ819_15820 [Streptomyces venezuelae]|uniref:hypothetical protein n=1 Tax=Streptomyces venezuelae TaxID=54571 RepID=UPI003449E8A7
MHDRILAGNRYDHDTGHDALVKAVRGVVVGSCRGGVMALNDDPAPELSTLYVDPQWLRNELGAEPRPERGISKLGQARGVFVSVPAGETSAEVTVPTLKGEVSEPEESLKAQLYVYDTGWRPQPGPVITGRVRDAS